MEKNDLSLFEIAVSHGLNIESCYNKKTILQRISELSRTEFMDFVLNHYEITTDAERDSEMLGNYHDTN